MEIKRFTCYVWNNEHYLKMFSEFQKREDEDTDDHAELKSLYFYEQCHRDMNINIQPRIHDLCMKLSFM